MSRAIATLIILLTLLAAATPALAGGWATVRLDEPPGEVPVGQTWRFGFMVLQHDRTPNSDVTPIVRAVHRDTGEEVTATAVQDGAVGHFVAELTLPLEGEWKWEIQPEPFAETTFATLQVVDAARMTYLWQSPVRARMAIAPPARAYGPTRTIEMLDSWSFSPASLTIEPGTTVTWVNRSTFAHQVTAEDLNFEDSGLIEPGDSFTITFTEPGTYHYRCSPHPGMEGEIVVS
jgi:plastocyanin